jgi:hypothetical protein
VQWNNTYHLPFISNSFDVFGVSSTRSPVLYHLRSTNTRFEMLVNVALQQKWHQRLMARPRFFLGDELIFFGYYFLLESETTFSLSWFRLVGVNFSLLASKTYRYTHLFNFCCLSCRDGPFEFLYSCLQNCRTFKKSLTFSLIPSWRTLNSELRGAKS